MESAALGTLLLVVAPVPGVAVGLVAACGEELVEKAVVCGGHAVHGTSYHPINVLSGRPRGHPDVQGRFLPVGAVGPHMRIRGERACRDCGTRWSYYETGSVTCPACGSLLSVGVDERTEHTAGPADLDLTPARDALDAGRPIQEVLATATEACRSYVRATGFIEGGELRPLGDTVLAALELRHVADVVDRSFAPDEAEELYLLALLRGADFGDRPDPEDVPATMRGPRGLAAAAAVEAYRGDVRTCLDRRPEGPLRAVLASIDEQVRRVRALQGDVPVREAERLVSATREAGRYLIEGDEATLARARERLEALP